MSGRFTRTLVLAVVYGGFVGDRPAGAQTATGPNLVALSGTTTPDGTTTYKTFLSPVLNNDGQVAFLATLNGLPSPNAPGIFGGVPGAIQTIVRQGDIAVGAGSPTLPATYLSLTSPVLSDGGQVAFRAGLTGGSTSDGIFTGTLGGGVQAFVLTGTPAPISSTPPTLFSSINSDVTVSGSGLVAFVAGLSGPAGGPTSGVFAGVPGTTTVQPAALSGPGTGLTSFTVGGAAVNDAGGVAFIAFLSSGPSLPGLVVKSPHLAFPVVFVQQGGAAPGGGTYNFFSQPAYNSSDLMVFSASLAGGSSGTGLFSQSFQLGTPAVAVARPGDPAPGGGTFAGFHSPVLNNAGQLAFHGDTSVTGVPAQGVFTGLPGGLQAVAQSGTPAPAGGTFDRFNSPVLNSSGQVAFTAFLRTGVDGVTSDNDFGLYAGSPTGVVKIVREGDQVVVGASQRTVANLGITFGLPLAGTDDSFRGQSFSDPGLLVYELKFTDGSSGIFTSQLAPVPGDYNHNGVVDAADYVLWRKGDPAADGNGDTMVDQSDYDFWRARFGNAAAGAGSGVVAGAAVPEPAGAALLIVGLLATCSCRRSGRAS